LFSIFSAHAIERQIYIVLNVDQVLRCAVIMLRALPTFFLIVALSVNCCVDIFSRAFVS
jgi:hypothetical protein